MTGYALYDPEKDGAVHNYFPMIYAKGVRGVTIDSLTIDGGGHAYDADTLGDFALAAIHSRDAHNMRVRDVNVDTWIADGIGIQGGSAIVSGCMVEGCHSNGLHPGTSIERSVWIGNISRENVHGFHFCKNVQNTICADNLFLNNREHGIRGLADPDRYNVVVGNISAENGGHGLEARFALGNVVGSNLFRDNSQAASGEYAGIYMREHRLNAVIGNAVIDTQEQPTQTQAIRSDKSKGDNLFESNFRPKPDGTGRPERG